MNTNSDIDEKKNLELLRSRKERYERRLERRKAVNVVVSHNKQHDASNEMVYEAEAPKLSVNMNATGITSLVLRMDNLTNFALIGGALVQQTSPNSITLDEAVSAVQAYVRKVQESNGNGVVESFEEQPILSQGTQTRLYGAYYPNQYHDNANWMQLTIIFPQPGSVDGGLLLNNDAGPTATPDPDGDEISGYFPFDGFQDSHLEVFVTPTPEPDSAAMEP